MRLYGKRPVLERVKTNPKTIRAVYVEQNVHASEVVRVLKDKGIRFASLSREDFEKMAGNIHASGGTSGAASDSRIHAQGILAEVAEFLYAPMEDLLKEEPRKTLFFLDGVTDPQNVGNILRNVACFGGIAVVLPKHDSAEINETVLRVACGGENYVSVAQVTNLVQAAQIAKKAGYWIAGAVAEGGTPLPEVSWPWPIGVVLGSEGSGIRPGLAKHLDLKVTLPMPGAPLSFNVATAATLFAYELVRRRPQ